MSRISYFAKVASIAAVGAMAMLLAPGSGSAADPGPTSIHSLPPAPGGDRPANVPRRWNWTGDRYAPAIGGTGGEVVPQAVGPSTAAIFYPADMTNHGGSKMVSSKQHLVYVNCSSGATSCWGGPATFVKDLAASSFITVTNQYVGSSATNRYPLGMQKSVSWTLSHFTTDATLRGKLDSFVQSNGNLTGLGNLYHIFLVNGQDVCFDSGLTQCYSPDNGSTFYFCGYHSYFISSGAGHPTIYYSVEPYQKVPGCETTNGSGTPLLLDSTASTLSHEIFEAITDPGLNAWYVPSGLLLSGNEVGDLCVWRRYSHTIGSHSYYTQLEYSNASHACKNLP